MSEKSEFSYIAYLYSKSLTSRTSWTSRTYSHFPKISYFWKFFARLSIKSGLFRKEKLLSDWLIDLNYIFCDSVAIKDKIPGGNVGKKSENGK